MQKSDILGEFSSNPEKYYTVQLFENEGFNRRSCSKCGRFFWTADPDRATCPEDSQDAYSFIGDPPTSVRLDYTGAWRRIEDFFVRHGHASIGRYPVVCRWRDDLHFTIASIVDFQRIMGSKVVFEFPANPLVVPQTCLRFKDLENVGVTGRHFSSFCMIGQHSVPDDGGYWKDECIDLDFTLLTKEFGIPRKEIVFVEDVWVGGGSFGSSLEYFVKGLELGNAVFTEFQGELGRHTVLDQKIIDMGAGLERFAWITMGTPTAYDCCFGPVLGVLLDRLGLEPDDEFLVAYFISAAKNLEGGADLNSARRIAAAAAGISADQAAASIAPLEGAYMVADHLRTLIFAISDGALPSNVGGGYNLRMMLRRIIATAGHMGLTLNMDELVDLHVDYLRDAYPELDGKRDDVKEILEIEGRRYAGSRDRMAKVASRISARPDPPEVDELLTLYESDGITPEYLRELGAISEIPPSFYSRLSDLHQSSRKAERGEIPLDGVPETELLYYADDPLEFRARVTGAAGSMIALDRTSFYPRGGGQEPDHGTIAGFQVTDVVKHGNVVIHHLEGGAPPVGATVQCTVDHSRRSDISKNHTSTHILNASARSVLGSWVWQHSAFKEADHARLDITHHSPLSESQVRSIEKAANETISKDLPVTIRYYDRGAAERKYGFSIYQGGVIPVKSVRIVSIGDMDDEACGGTHVSSTGKISLIRVTRTKRIQDGVVRIEFVSGRTALEYDARRDGKERGRREAEAAKARRDALRDARRARNKERMPELLSAVTGVSDADIVQGIAVSSTGDGRGCLAVAAEYDERFHVDFGRMVVRADPTAVYCGIFEDGPTIRVMVHAGPRSPSHKRADLVARRIAKALEGSAGGTASFAQGGGRIISRKADAVELARSVVLG